MVRAITSRIVRLVRSPDYRQRLLEGIEDIEREVIDYAQRHNLRTIGGYRLDFSGEHLRMTRLPPEDLEQLQLFESTEEQVGSSSLVAEYSRPEGQQYRGFRIRLRPSTSDSSPRIASPADVYEILPEMRTLDREHFMSLHLNTKNRLTAVETVAVGTLNASLLHPREVFKGAMLNNASSLIVAHNHPSGNPKPSEEDVRLTRRLAKVGEILGVPLMDHVVIGRDTYRSLREEGVAGG